ncbi:MAG: MtrB/PioB family decaheme-associated outer membrane protein, partial [Ramlibacter sp.]
RLSGGYYGSFYRNSYGSVTPDVPAALFASSGALLPLSTGLRAILNQPVALAPDNQAHHLDLTGSYGISRTTQLNFKMGYSHATQHQDFAAAGLTGAPAGVSNLGGKVSTTLAQVGVTSRPMPKLSLSASMRYEHKDDQTPLAAYNIEGLSTYTNRQLPRTDWHGKTEAGYQINSDWKATLGADFQSVDRGVFTATSAVAGLTALRQKTEEVGVRAQLRGRLSDELSGAVSLETSRRDGSNWLRNNSGAGVTEISDPSSAASGFANGIFMPNLADRQRDKLKLQADWQPTEKLALQLVAETGRDRFSSPSIYGLHSAGLRSLSLDGSFAVNDKWSLNSYVSYGRQALDQSRPDASIMAFDNKSTTLGIGFTGKPTAKWDVGGTLSFMDDRSIYAQTLDSTSGGANSALLAATGGLPDTVFRQTTLRLFGKYAIDKQSAFRIDLGHQRTTWTDWAWGYSGTPFVYSDGTTVNRKSGQSVSFLAVTYTRKWP